jgi:nucleotide-binding universal stress UspA family protein
MTEQTPFQRIVVPLDGSKWAEKAIPHAEQIARGGGELILLHIFKPTGSQYIGEAALANQTVHIEQARRNAEQYVKGLRARITSQSIRVRAHVMEGNDIAQLVCNFVNAENGDVVVMPAGQQNRLMRALFGDLTSAVSGCVTACLLLVRGNSEAEWDAESQKAMDAGPSNTLFGDNSPAVPASAVLLQQLISLRDAGILTADEFEAKRAALQQRG